MKILVTGGQGFLGGALTRALMLGGEHVVSVTVRRRAPELEALGVRVVYADLRDAKAAALATEGQDLIFHTAAKAGIWGNPADYYATNVGITEALLAGAQTHGVRYFVHTSSPSVTFAGVSQIGLDESAPYSESPLNAYCATKILAEQKVLEFDGQQGMRTMALRPHLIYGPGDPHLLPRICEAASKKRLFRIGDGTNRVDITHINDAVACHLAVLVCQSDDIWGRPYFVTSGRPVLLWHWIDEILRWKGLPEIRHTIKLSWAVKLGSAFEMIYRLLRLQREPRLTRFSALQLGCSHTYSIDRARQLLGYRPRVDPYEDFSKQLHRGS